MDMSSLFILRCFQFNTGKYLYVLRETTPSSMAASRFK